MKKVLFASMLLSSFVLVANTAGAETINEKETRVDVEFVDGDPVVTPDNGIGRLVIGKMPVGLQFESAKVGDNAVQRLELQDTALRNKPRWIMINEDRKESTDASVGVQDKITPWKLEVGLSPLKSGNTEVNATLVMNFAKELEAYDSEGLNGLSGNDKNFKFNDPDVEHETNIKPYDMSANNAAVNYGSALTGLSAASAKEVRIVGGAQSTTELLTRTGTTVDEAHPIRKTTADEKGGQGYLLTWSKPELHIPANVTEKGNYKATMSYLLTNN